MRQPEGYETVDKEGIIWFETSYKIMEWGIKCHIDKSQIHIKQGGSLLISKRV